MTDKQRVTSGQAQVIRLYQWCAGLDDDSAAALLEAAAADVINAGGVFAMRGGALTYQSWLKRLWPRLDGLALTLAMGSDAWWWEALDRARGLALAELGAIESARGVPDRAPLGLDYGDLMRGVLRAAGVPMDPRRGSGRASGGRKAVPQV